MSSRAAILTPKFQLGGQNVKANSLQELYVEQLADLYSAEQQIIKALPDLIEAAQSEELRSALTEHLEVTREHATRIESIFEDLDQEIEKEKCKGMEGVIKEGSELVEDIDDEDVRDAGIIAAAQRVEHYEMAGYGTARTYASLLGYDDAANLLQKTLTEEKEADQKLTSLAEELNVEALEHGEAERPAARSKASQKPPRAKRVA